MSKRLAEHKKAILNRTVYHVGEYMPNHPGGQEYIEDRLGKVIDTDFEEAEHTKSARNIMNELPVIGSLISDN